MREPWKRVITGVAEAIDRFDDDYGTNFAEVRDEVVAVFKADPAYEEYGIDDFSQAVGELAEAETRKEFDSALGGIYDWADNERVWISPVPAENVWLEPIEEEAEST